jgi:hypothetical protein
MLCYRGEIRPLLCRKDAYVCDGWVIFPRVREAGLVRRRNQPVASDQLSKAVRLHTMAEYTKILVYTDSKSSYSP